MDRNIKIDVLEIVKAFKKNKKENHKIQCAMDYYYLNNLIEYFMPWQKSLVIPDNIYKIYHENKNLFENKEAIIQNQIMDNIDLLIKIYNDIILCFNNYSYKPVKYNEDYQFDLNIYRDFFKKYDNIDDLYKKVIDSDHLYFCTNSECSCTYTLNSINKHYVFIDTTNVLHTIPSIAHEFGHVYQSSLENNDNGFLSEFMSVLLEMLFIEYYQDIDNNLTNLININELNIWKCIFKSALNQLKLLKLSPSIYKNMKLDKKFENDNLLDNGEFYFKKDDLYLQYYPIGFIAALKQFYLLKYGIDFNEAVKFLIIAQKDNNLTNLLNSCFDLEIIKQYLREKSLDNKLKVKTLI